MRLQQSTVTPSGDNLKASDDHSCGLETESYAADNRPNRTATSGVSSCRYEPEQAAVKIQTAWRSYVHRRQRGASSSADPDSDDTGSNMQLSSSPATSLDAFDHHPRCSSTAYLDPAHHHQPSPADRDASPGRQHHHTTLIEPDPNSVASDYSEMGEPIREHLANVQIIGREDLDLGNISAAVRGSSSSPPSSPLPPPTLGGGGAPLPRAADETDDEYARRVRKTNYLSLAQEFAALKRLNAEALPFDLHRDEYHHGRKPDDEAAGRPGEQSAEEEDGAASDAGRPGRPIEPVPDVVPDVRRSAGPSSDSAAAAADRIGNRHHADAASGRPKSERRGTPPVEPAVEPAAATQRRSAAEEAAACLEEFDVYTIESALQNVEWHRLEASIQQSAGDDRKRWSRCGDRDEIRRRLAMSADDDYAGFDLSPPGRKSQQAFHNRMLHSATSLQVCYLNDDAASFDRELGGTQKSTCTKPDIIPKSISEASTLASVHSKPSAASTGPGALHEDFFTKQARLQAEAKLALAQVRPMAHMQLQLEKEMRKKSPLSENVVGIPGFVDGKMRQLTRQLLQRMNIAQLQVVVNDLHTQIEVLNADLMQQLVDRDDLHMAQDSMLVDIDDLTRRAQEFAAKVNMKQVAGDGRR